MPCVTLTCTTTTLTQTLNQALRESTARRGRVDVVCDDRHFEAHYGRIEVRFEGPDGEDREAALSADAEGGLWLLWDGGVETRWWEEYAATALPRRALAR